MFTINSSTGALNLVAQNFESGKDTDGNNDYSVTIVATDLDKNFAQLALLISVTDVDEAMTYMPPLISGANGDITSSIEAVKLIFSRPALSRETALNGGEVIVDGNKWALFTWREAKEYCHELSARLPTQAEFSDNLLPLVNNGSFHNTAHWLINKGYWSSTSASAGQHYIMRINISPAKIASLGKRHRQYVICVR